MEQAENNSGPDIMKISDVAAAVGLNKSTVSRIVKANPDLVQGTSGRSILISKTAFNLVRHQTVNRAKSGNHAGRVTGELQLQEDTPESAAGSGSRMLDARTRTEIAKAARAEMDLQIRQGELVEVAEVRKYIFDAFRMVRDELLSYPARTSVDLASMSAQREVKSYQSEAVEAMLSRLGEIIKRDIGKK